MKILPTDATEDFVLPLFLLLQQQPDEVCNLETSPKKIVSVLIAVYCDRSFLGTGQFRLYVAYNNLSFFLLSVRHIHNL